MARKAPDPPPTDDSVALVPFTEEALSEVVTEINGILRDGAVQTMILVGRHVVRDCFDGDMAAWNKHGPKAASYRQLAEHPDLKISATGLHRAVGLYELDSRLGVSERKQLTVTHLRAVLGLPEEVQRKLIEKAEEEGWSSTQMDDAAKVARRKTGNKRGRPPDPRVVKTLRRLVKATEGDDAFADMADLKNRAAVLSDIETLRARLDELQARLEAVPAEEVD